MNTQLYDISRWHELPSSQTEGTRDKRKILSSYDGTPYYFKTSFSRGERDYKTEFWSEVIASRIGALCGFNVLRYDVAVINTEQEQLIGCISKSLFVEGQEDMISGYNLIVQYTPDFCERYKERGYHSLPLILDTLKAHDIAHVFDSVLDMWLFDAIIGNGDRHSENWAVIRDKRPDSQGKDWSVWLAPIYDSGSSLGRELTEERIVQHLNNPEQMMRYIGRSTADIAVKAGGGRSVFEYLPSFIKQYHDRLIPRFHQLMQTKSEELRSVIFDVDRDIVGSVPIEYRLSEERKELIYQLIIERIRRINKAVTEYDR